MKMSNNPFFLAAFVLFCTACTETKTNKQTNQTAKEMPDNRPMGVKKIEQAHHRDDFLAKKAIQFDFVLFWGGAEKLNASVTLLTNSAKGLIKYANGESIIFDQNKVYCSPSLADNKRVRFNAYTWPYFFLLPYKLSDKGIIFTEDTPRNLKEQEYNTKKLTFEKEVGDAPDDWYLIYTDPKTERIKAAAYIVTMGKTIEKAEESPHAITYDQYTDVTNVPIASSWSYWEWNKEEGITEKIGHATLTNIHFLQNTDGLFDPPNGFLER